MPTLSQKAASMPASPIRKLVPYADTAKARGIYVYHLNIGQPDISSPQIALDAVKNNTLKLVEYSHSAGILSFRKKLMEYYHKYQIEVSADEIIVTNGGSEGIMFAFMACLNPGDEVLVTEPFYANYNGFAIYTGAVVKPIRAKIENGFALPPIEEFEKHITSKTKAILVCNPNNPTGYLYSREELELLATIVKKHNLFLFSDEVYREFCYDNEKYHSVMDLKGIEENVVLLDSVSKRYSACGCRVGVFITKNKELYNAAMKFAQARLSPPTYGQIFSEAAIDTSQEYFDEVVREYTLRRNTVVEAINKMDGCFCPNPKGAFYAVARLPIDNADRFCQWLLEDFSYENKTVMLAPATGFYSTEGAGANEVRISYVLNVDDLLASMKCLEEALKVYPERTV
ncbi:MAG: pyridoxal phosphate-dependent aminotransferase [Bacteroidales bacterium]|jgi:aspartate aminotransferase|nr:pyridoxal phosphate-dependent aminotransferase [Bacteroidales bacterium]